MTVPVLNVLIVDDMREVCELHERSLRKATAGAGVELRVTSVLSGRLCLDRLADGEHFDLILLDLHMPGLDGFAVLERMDSETRARVVVVTAQSAAVIPQSRLERLRDQFGVHDVLKKSSQEMLDSNFVRTVLEQRELLPGVKLTRQQLDEMGFRDIIGVSEPFLEAFRLAMKLARARMPVLITGKSGSGKEVFADVFRRFSDGRPFVTMNAATTQETLIETELFGHERGAFTGAIGVRQGLFEAADGGTLFLDEIGDMPLPMQVKILRVAQAGEYIRVGSNQVRRVDVRLIAATNKDLYEEIKAGRFREDLLYRLNVWQIKLPTLEERGADDVEALALFFARKHGLVRGLTMGALGRLKDHQWTGEVRELENVFRALTIHVADRMVTADDVERALRGQEWRPSAAVQNEPGCNLSAAVQRIREQLDMAIKGEGDEEDALKAMLHLFACLDGQGKLKALTAERLGELIVPERRGRQAFYYLRDTLFPKGGYAMRSLLKLYRKMHQELGQRALAAR